MAAELGTITYTSVSWTTGDVITEAKLDNMVANDQAYDSHQAQGLLLNNARSLAGKTTAAANKNLIKVNSSDEVEIGDTAVPNKVIGGAYQAAETYTPAGAGTATLDLSKSNRHVITMPAGNITIALSNTKVGQKFIVEIIQDSVGSRTVTWFSTIKWAGGSAPTLTTTANKKDTVGFVVTSVGNYDGYVIGQNV